MPLTVWRRGRVAELVGDEDPPVPVGLRVRLRVHLGQDHRRVDVARLVGQAEVERQVGPVVGERVEDLLEALGEGHAAQAYPVRTLGRDQRSGVASVGADRVGALARRPRSQTEPPNGSRLAHGRSSSPGRIPRSARKRSISGSESETRANDAPRARLELGERHAGLVAASVELAVGDRVAVRIVRADRRAPPRSAPPAPRRCSARAPRPRRGPGPRASPAPRPGRTRAAGDGGSPRARRARPVGQERAAVGLVVDQAHLVHALQHRGHRAGRDAEALGQRRGRDRAVAALGQRVQRLRVVLDGLGVERLRVRLKPECAMSDAHQEAREIEGDQRPPRSPDAVTASSSAAGPRRASTARSGRSPG